MSTQENTRNKQTKSMGPSSLGKIMLQSTWARNWSVSEPKIVDWTYQIKSIHFKMLVPMRLSELSRAIWFITMIMIVQIWNQEYKDLIV